MNEMMIQEAVLNSIDDISKSQLFAEFDVLMSMNAAYAKSAMIQEAAPNLTFDGVSIIQEASETDKEVKKAERSYKLSNMKKKFMNLGLIKWIIKAIAWCRKQLSKLFKKKKITKSEADKLAANVGSMTVNGSQYDAGELKKSRTTVDSGMVPGEVVNGTFDGVIELRSINISGFRMIADIDTLEKAVEAFVSVVDTFAQLTMLESTGDDLKKTASFGKDCVAVDKLCQKALDTAAKKTYGDANYGELYHQLYNIDSDLGKAQKRMEDLVKQQKQSDYYDSNNNKISATQYEKNLTEDDRANLTDKQKASLNRDIDRDFRTKTISATCRRLVNLIGSTQACFAKMKAEEPAKFQQYLNEENKKLEAQLKAKADAKPTMPELKI